MTEFIDTTRVREIEFQELDDRCESLWIVSKFEETQTKLQLRFNQELE